jgi:hypothetical protein
MTSCLAPLFEGMNVIEYNKAKIGTSPQKKTFLIKFRILP